MSSLLESLGKLKVSIWQFWRLVHNANRDLPYHDYLDYENESGEEQVYPYVVGSNNVSAHGDQNKHFVAKRTLIWSYDAIHFRLNSPSNVIIHLKVHQRVLEDVIYQMELHTNIHIIYFILATGQYLHAYFEGVLPEEARNPE